jgi:hypothetical protein
MTLHAAAHRLDMVIAANPKGSVAREVIIRDLKEFDVEARAAKRDKKLREAQTAEAAANRILAVSSNNPREFDRAIKARGKAIRAIESTATWQPPKALRGTITPKQIEDDIDRAMRLAERIILRLKTLDKTPQLRLRQKLRELYEACEAACCAGEPADEEEA